jgi:putative CocE/NonD family hydrolase
MLMGAALGGSVCAAAPDATDAAKVRFEWGTRIPLRDGIQLNATTYLPLDQVAPTLCLVTLTPYIADSYHDRGIYFAAHGLPFVAVDVRGRGNSEGIFSPFLQEAQDGFDVVEWLARQTYCAGKVAMWGGSYAGYDQWATAKELPPHLVSIVPASAPYMGVDIPSWSNIPWSFLIKYLTYTSGRTSQTMMHTQMPEFWEAIYKRWFVSGRPFKELDRIAGNPSATFQEWLEHPHPDAYWDRFNPTPSQYARISIPVLTITGTLDISQPGALTHYREHMRNASEEARAQHYLIIGPWNHAGTRTPVTQFGSVTFGEASLVDLPRLHLDWYKWVTHQGPRPAFLQNRVAYYVMGAEKWRYADSLDAITAESRAYFFRSNGNPSEVSKAGSLALQPSDTTADHWSYDPRDLSAAETESPVDIDRVDRRLQFVATGQQLIYRTAQFEHDTEISGFFKLTAWLAIDQPDTDFAVSIYEIGADGSSMLLSTDAMRARYRKSWRQPLLIRTTHPLRYDFEHFTFISRQIKKGSRLQLALGPLNSMHSEKNYNSGGVIAEESMKDARPVNVTFYHDRSHPSALYVPCGQKGTPQ